MDPSIVEPPLGPEEVRKVYRRRARHYDFTSHLYGLLGYRLERYRAEGIAGLQLKPGHIVVELGCGTGANFSALEAAVGPRGRVIGVDLSDRMLDVARERIASHGWHNVDLVLSEAGAFRYPESGVDGVLSTFALTLFPDFDDVIERAAAALKPHRRLVVVDFRAPDAWPDWLLRAIIPLLRPFGVTLGLVGRKPWLSVQRQMDLVSMELRYLGTTYIAVGEAHSRA